MQAAASGPARAAYDVSLVQLDPQSAAVEIGMHLHIKGFCIVDVGLEPEVLERARREAESLSSDRRLSQVPSLISGGLLGAEGSAQALSVGDLGRGDSPGIMRIDAAFRGVGSMIGDVLPALGFRCPQRSVGCLHETGMPPEAAPQLTEAEAAAWLPTFTRGRILLLVALGPIKGTLELSPFAEDAEPLEVPTVPGSLIVLRSDIMSHQHFAHSQAFILSCFLLEAPALGPKEEMEQKARMPPCAMDLETWTIQRLQEVKEEEDETERRVELPEGWRSIMDRMFHTEQRCAVRGMAGRFCGAFDLYNWYGGQVPGSDFVTRVPLTRWDVTLYYDPDPEGWRRGKSYLQHFSYCDGMEMFDCKFFTLSPMESKGMDPHQRQILEVGYEACKNAGYPKGKLMNNLAGVYVGSTITTFGNIADAGATGAAASITSNRFSYCLGLKGPSLTVDTENAASLTAVHIGADAVLEKGRGVINNFSLCAGVNVNLASMWWPQMQAAGLLSATGRCMTWNSFADGSVFADCVGAVVLKRYTETVDGERQFIEDEPLVGVIASSTLNTNGRAASMNAPHGPSMMELIADAIRNAHISPTSIDAVEVDGHNGVLADAVEVDSAARVLRGCGQDSVGPLCLTALKTNIGNGVEGAGIASLLKVLLGNQYGLMTPACHLSQINPHIDPCHDTSFLTELQMFSMDHMYVAVTATGYGGTNAHVVTFGQPCSALASEEPREHKPEPLGFWPGGGGELEDKQVPFRGYYIMGSWSRWTPEAMQEQGAGVFGCTVTLGENLWEDFQILLDGDRKLRLHPGQHRATKDSLVLGPDSGSQAKWRIDGRRRRAAVEVPSLPGLTTVGSATASSSAATVGDRYRVALRVAGKYRMITWEKLAETADPSSIPKGTMYVAADWSGWTLEPMVAEGDGWSTEVLLLRAAGQFHLARNGDWGQVVAPTSTAASSSSPGYGPDEFRGLSWGIKGTPGDVIRLSARRQAEDEDGAWTVSWEHLRSEALTEAQRLEGQRTRLGVTGSWSDFSLMQELAFQGDASSGRYHFFATIGAGGLESFQLLRNLDWNLLVHPDRYVDGSSTSHRVCESHNDGSAMDLVWALGGASDLASPGDHFRIDVVLLAGKVTSVAWSRAEGTELARALADGRVLGR